MKIEPLAPGLYICRFKPSMKAGNINHILNMLNNEGEPFGIRFVPELPDTYQILNQGR